jgi:hypothetical protein
MGFFLDLVANLLASWLDSLLTPYGMTGVVIAIAGTVLSIRYWHRQQRAAKKLGMASWWFIALSCVVALLSVGGASYGLALKFSAPTTTPTIQPATSFFWMLPKAAAEIFVPSGADAAATLRELLLSGNLIAMGKPHYGNAGDSTIQIPTAEWQSLNLAGSELRDASSSFGPSSSYDNLEIAMATRLQPEQENQIIAPYRDQPHRAVPRQVMAQASLKSAN